MRNEFSVEKIIHSGLLGAREKYLREQYKNSHRNLAVFEKLGEVCRQQGKLAEAAELYREWLAIEPASEKAIYLEAVFNNKIPARAFSEKGFMPSPFFREENFLPQAAHDELLSFAMESKDDFLPSMMLCGNSGNKIFTPEINSSRGVALPSHLKDILLRRVKPLIPVLRQNFMMEDLKQYSLRLKMLHYGDGDFCKGHTDNNGDLPGITIVYYFSFPQVRFTGGEFILFDLGAENDRCGQSGFTQIPFTDNQLLAFPNNAFHEILPVSCLNNRFEEGRFAIPIHLRPENDGIATSVGHDAVVQKNI